MALYLLVIVLLHVPAVQSAIGSKVSEALAEKLGTQVNVGRVDLGFFNRIIIDDVDIYDQAGKRMLHASRLAANIELIPILQGKIAISSAQLFGFDGNFYQANEESKPNFQFVLDSLASKDTTSHTPIDLRINSVIVRNGAVRFDRHYIPTTTRQLNLSHLNVKNISAHLMLKQLTDSTLHLNVKKISLQEQSGLDLRHLSFKVDADHSHTLLRDFNLQMPGSTLLIDTLEATYSMIDGQIAKPTIKFNGNIHDTSITPYDLRSFLPSLVHFKNPIFLNTTFSGTSTTMRVSHLHIHSEDNDMELLANGWLNNWSHPHWNATIERLNLSGETIDFVTKNIKGESIQIPDEITRLGNVHYRGVIGGSGNNISTKGILRTDAGNANLGIGLRGNSFTGRIETEGINLRRILNNDDFGTIATHINVDGLLPQGNQLSLKANGKVSRFDYKSYSYRDITIDGQYQNNLFNGLLAINDPNGEVKLEGQFNSDIHAPNAKLKAEVHHLNPSAMKLTDEWKGAVFELVLDANLNGTSLNTLMGDLDVDVFSMKSPDKEYVLDNLHISADKEEGQRTLRLVSDFADMTVRGNYDYQTLAQSITRFVASKLPTLPGLPHSARNYSVNDNNFTLSATIKQSDWLNKLFDLPVTLTEPAYLYGHLNDRQNVLNLECSVPVIYIDGSRYEEARLSLRTPNDTLFARADVLKVMDNGERFSWNIDANAVNNRLLTSISFDNNQQRVFRGSVHAEADFYKNPLGKATAHVNILPSEFQVSDTIWHVMPSEILYNSEYLSIDHFSVEHNKQHLTVSGRATKNPNDSISVDLQDIDVNYITNLVNFHAVEFGGKASGHASVRAVFGSPSANAQLTVNKFTFMYGNMGTLTAKVSYDDKKEMIDIDAVANDGPLSRTLIKGYISPENDKIDLAIEPHNSRLEFVEYFCDSFMRNTDLRGTGNLRLWGALSELNLTGEAVANGTLEISSLNTKYWLANDTVRLIENNIVFSNDTIRDRDNHIGIINGRLHHDHLSDLSYDVRVTAQNLLAYDFREYGEDTFFGTVWATGDCTLRGKDGEVVIDVNATPEKGSFIEYNASAPDAIGSQEFIEWRDVTPSRLQAETSQQNTLPVVEEIPSDLRLNFLINCTPDATLRLLMDHTTNDKIALNGSGTIRATYFNKGSFDMFGTYLVDRGSYNLTIQNVIKKDFIFQQGGTIVFGGDPFNATLDLKALYTVNAVPLSDLNIGNSFSNNNTRVDCIMNITGHPSDPKVDFDLDVPNVSSDAKQMVKNIINSQEEMNMQVIYLLGIGRFYTEQTNNAGRNGEQQSQASLAMQSILSGTISQQINNVLSSMFRSSNWNFGANISTGTEGFYNAEYEGLLSGSLLNNRLLINGQFGYRDNAASATTTFIGDFDIRYLLFPSGNMAIKVYNQTNDRYFTRSSLNTQGIGLIMKKDFNGLKDLFGHSRKRARRRNQR